MSQSSSSPLLQVERVCKSIGALAILHDVSFSAARGEVVGLIGPNGSGKTTCLNLLSGLARPESGQVYLNGASLLRLRPVEIARRGVARVFQTSQRIAGLSVSEFLAIGQYRHCSFWERLRPVRSILSASDSFADLFAASGLDLQKIAHAPIDALPFVQRRLLEFLQAMMTNPALLLVDELGAGLREKERASIARVLRGVSATGVGVVVVEHDASFMRAAADRCVLLSAGRVLAVGKSADVISSQDFRKIYVGA